MNPFKRSFALDRQRAPLRLLDRASGGRAQSRTKLAGTALAALAGLCAAAACTSASAPSAEPVARTSRALAIAHEDIAGEAGAPGCPTEPALITWDATTAASILTVDPLYVVDYVQQQRGSARTNLARCSGKWYWEIALEDLPDTDLDYSNFAILGVGDVNAPLSPLADGSEYYVGNTADSWSYYPSGAMKYNDSEAGNYGPYGVTANTGDVIGVALDIDDQTLTFYKNGISLGVAFTNIPSGVPLYPMIGTAELYFAASARFSPPFAYAPPAGYAAYGGIAPSALTCTAGQSAAGSIAFSSAVDGLSLTGTSSVSSADGSSTTWTIASGTMTVLTGTSQTAQGSTTTEIDYNAFFTGLQQTIFTYDGTTLSGSVNGRAIVPVTSGGDGSFQDGNPPPAVEPAPGIQQAIYDLLDQAQADAPNVCPGSPAESDAGASPIASLLAALWHAPSSPASSPASVANAGAGGAGTSAEGLHAQDAPTWGTGPGGVPGLPYSEQQNNTLLFNTTDCKACVSGCAATVWNWFVPWAVDICVADCFIPDTAKWFGTTSVGGCAEKICPVAGVASCDKSDSACCGIGSATNPGGCCPGGSVCGSYDLGTCCPADAPVACGDYTGSACAPAGSTCCGGGSSAVVRTGSGALACESGSSCVNMGTTDTTIWGCCPTGQILLGSPDAQSAQNCCAADRVYGGSPVEGVGPVPAQCCDQPLCGSQCCGDSGARCTNGQCVFPILDGGTCTPGAPAGPSVPDSAWGAASVSTWSDPTITVTVTIQTNPAGGFDVSTVETQFDCGSNAPAPDVTASATGVSDQGSDENPWTGTVESPCVSNPPGPPTSVDFVGANTKSFLISRTSAGPWDGWIYLTLFAETCQSGAPTQYQVRYTRIASGGAIYSDYMLSPQSKLQ